MIVLQTRMFVHLYICYFLKERVLGLRMMSNCHTASWGQLEYIIMNYMSYIHGGFCPAWAKSDHCIALIWEQGKEQVSFSLSSHKMPKHKTWYMLILHLWLLVKKVGKASCIIKDLCPVISLTSFAPPSYCTVSEQQNGDHTLLLLVQQRGLIMYGLYYAMLWLCCHCAWASALLVICCCSLLIF